MGEGERVEGVKLVGWSRFLVPPPVSPARGPPTDWGELVQIHDDRDVFQATDRRTARDRYSQPLSGAGRDPRMSGYCELGRGLRRREKSATEAGAGRYEKPAPDARAAPPEAHESLISRKTVEESPLTGLYLNSPIGRGWRVVYDPRRFDEPLRGDRRIAEVGLRRRRPLPMPGTAVGRCFVAQNRGRSGRQTQPSR